MNQIQQSHDTAKERRMQVVMPLDLGLRIPEGDPLSLLIEVTEEMDYRELEAAYERREKAGEATAKQLFQLVIFGFLSGYYTLRKLRDACRYDLRMIYLLHGKRVPSHARFGDFIRNRLRGEVMENLFYQLIMKLLELEEISFENLFVDGTKIEANANRYSFVWAKTVTRNEEKMQAQIQMKLMELQTQYNCFDTPPTLKDMLDYLNGLWKATGKERTNGKGRRKSELQKDIEDLEEYQGRQEKYEEHRQILKGRPSYSKTDRDATFMRMKEDHMKNGQLKPGYNLQLGIEGEYIVTAGLFSERSDSQTLLPLLDRLEEKTGKRPEHLIADAGYESEENHDGLFRRGIEAYIKPSNYEISKTRKHKANRFKAENMLYDEQTDSFTCPADKQLTCTGIRHVKSKYGYISEVSVYSCTGCWECPMKKQCTKSKTGRQIHRCKKFWEYRQQSHERITSEEGVLLRLNRSIQSEGTFGVLKQDWGFRRFLRRGSDCVHTELLLYAFAFNIAKLHAKIQNHLTGVIIHKLKAS